MNLMLFVGLAVWWTFAVVLFAALTLAMDGSPKERLVVAAFWPIVAVLGLPVLLWRIPFKTAKAIRADLRNRKLLKDFEKWLADRSNPK